MVPKEAVFLSGNKFWYSVGKTKMKAFRAYFEFAAVLQSYYDDSGSSAKINMDFDGTATGISGIGVNGTDDGAVYSVDGRLVSTKGTGGLAKGLYIVDGKKIIVR